LAPDEFQQNHSCIKKFATHIRNCLIYFPKPCQVINSNILNSVLVTEAEELKTCTVFCCSDTGNVGSIHLGARIHFCVWLFCVGRNFMTNRSLYLQGLLPNVYL